MPEIWKNNDLRHVNEMPISNIIFVFARECYLRMLYALLLFILNFFRYCMYCCFTFAYVDLHFKFIPQIP